MKNSTQTKNQGEGDKEAARRFNRQSKEFLNTSEAKAKLQKREHADENEKEELRDAERKARSHSKETDPQTIPDYNKPA